MKNSKIALDEETKRHLAVLQVLEKNISNDVYNVHPKDIKRKKEKLAHLIKDKVK